MKVLIICSGNFKIENNDLSINHAFIYEQIQVLKKHKCDIDIFYIKGKGILGYFNNIIKLRKYLKNNKYDVLHAHYGYSGLLASFAFQTPLVVTFHGSDINIFMSNILTTFARIKAQHLIYVSGKLKQKAIMRFEYKSDVIPCGVDFEIFKEIDKNFARAKLNLPLDSKVILFSSSFSNPIKNYTLAKKAVDKVQISNRFIEIKERTREEVCLLINAADVLLLTSFSEGSPQIIKEAMACNCPIVSVDVGDIKDITKNTTGCFIAAPNPDNLSEKITEALRFTGKTNGREKIENFNGDIIGIRILNIYNKISHNKHYIDTENLFSYKTLKPFKGTICSKGIWDESVPNISFNKDGSSNYSNIFNNISKEFPLNEASHEKLKNHIAEIKKQGKNKSYDCIIGVSGGTDSSYLLHLAKELGLKPLAVYLDNGWASNIALKNIEKLTKKLNIDLDTYVINYEEVKNVLKSFLRARLPWADAPTDLAIKAILYEKANKINVKYILIGHDFRSEGFQPNEWTYCDAKQLKYISKRFSNTILKSFPSMSIYKFTYFSFIKGIKMLKPYFYIPYDKSVAKEFLKKTYDWEDYGGHHYENIFTKFIITFWLYEKFGIDKRKITLSAQILSGAVKKEDAIKEIEHKPYEHNQNELDLNYVLKKLDMTRSEFNSVFFSENKFYYDYPSYYPMYENFRKVIFYLIKYFLPNKPLMFFQMEERQKKK